MLIPPKLPVLPSQVTREEMRRISPTDNDDKILIAFICIVIAVFVGCCMAITMEDPRPSMQDSVPRNHTDKIQQTPGEAMAGTTKRVESVDGPIEPLDDELVNEANDGDLEEAQALTVPDGATSALLQARDGAIKYRLVGEDPTATKFHTLAADASILLTSRLSKVRVQSDDGGLAFVTYFIR